MPKSYENAFAKAPKDKSSTETELHHEIIREQLKQNFERIANDALTLVLDYHRKHKGQFVTEEKLQEVESRLSDLTTEFLEIARANKNVLIEELEAALKMGGRAVDEKTKKGSDIVDIDMEMKIKLADAAHHFLITKKMAKQYIRPDLIWRSVVLEEAAKEQP